MRRCSACDSEIVEDHFVIEGGQDYYCSEKCLFENITLEAYMELYDDGEGDTYWTEWDEDDNDGEILTHD